MTADQSTTAALDVPLDVLCAQLTERLMAGKPSAAMVDQVHEFLAIDPDIAHREYLPFAHTHPAVTVTPQGAAR